MNVDFQNIGSTELDIDTVLKKHAAVCEQMISKILVLRDDLDRGEVIAWASKLAVSQNRSVVEVLAGLEGLAMANQTFPWE